MRDAKRNFWRKYKIAFGAMLFIIALFTISAFTDNSAIAVISASVPALVWIKGGKFTEELTENELQKLNEQDLAVYIKEYNESKLESVQKAFEEKLKTLISKSDFEQLQNSVKELNKKNSDNLELRIKEFQAVAEKISSKITKANEDAGNKNLSSFEISLKNAKTNKGVDLQEELKNHKNGNKFAFEIKATFVGGDVGTVTANVGNQRIPGIGQIASAKLVLSNFFRISPIQMDANGTVAYEDWDEATTIAAAAAIAEGGTFPESTAKFKTYTLAIEKIGDSISMTYEAMNDFTRFTRELARFITRNIQKVVNQALWNGSGVTPNIGGIYTRVDAFNAAGYTGATTTTPDLLDLIKVLKKQIMNGKDDKYEVNFAFVSWEDYLALSLQKDTTGRLIYPLGVPNVAGVEIIPTSFVADDTMVLGDKEYVELIGDPNAITIEAGYKTGDWEDDKESIKGRVRTALLIREADKDGFLKVTSIDAALTAITTV